MENSQPEGPPSRLIVFSDDWGGHPSSSQHLVARLLPRHEVLWVNTIGGRWPRPSREDLRKIGRRLREWGKGGEAGNRPAVRIPDLADGRPATTKLQVISPAMWPSFRWASEQQLNAKLLRRAVQAALGPRQPGERRVAITTIPLVADLVGELEVDGWLYYCVDDFSKWPGVDGRVMDRMERRLVPRCDAHLAVSAHLQDRLSTMGGSADVLTHGIDLEFWSHLAHGGAASDSAALPAWWTALPRPRLLFWGVVDPRLDLEACRRLATEGSLALVGPQDNPDPAVLSLAAAAPGSVDYALLPQLAASADLLVMPYADLPVTRAMQPLKFNEYLASGRPIMARRLPAVEGWETAADLYGDEGPSAEILRARAANGTPASQLEARRLEAHSWDEKARSFEEMIESLQRKS